MKEKTQKTITKIINILIAVVLIGGMIIPIVLSVLTK